MPIYKRNMYTPPSFHLFEKNPQRGGFLSLAWMSVNAAEGALRQTMKDLSSGWEPGAVPHAVSLYATWTEADDFLGRLMSMSEEERAKHLKLDRSFDLDKIMDRHAKVGAMIKQLEAEQPEALCELLDRQLKYELEEWLGHLVRAKNAGGLDFDDVAPGQMENVEDFADRRDYLEYARIGLRENRLDGRLKQLEFFDEFSSRLLASDELFRAVLDGKQGHRFWTDPTFWWHEHEPRKKDDPSMMATPWDRD